jgi:hypothetical protein
MKKPRILFQSAPFCYGPVATTLNVIKALIREDYHILAITEGPTGDLIRRSGLPVETVSLATAQPLSRPLQDLLETVDLVVSNTDLGFAAACRERGQRVAVIDTLFWMWDQIPPSLLDIDLYIVQCFTGIEPQLKRLGKPRNYFCVGPLVDSQEPPLTPAQRKNRIHVSLGGCDCAMVSPAEDPYPPFILEVLAEACAEALPRECDVVISCGERIASQLNPQYPRFLVRTLSNREYLETLRSARGILLSPGLTGTMEAFAAQTPVFFLPPQNYSQVLQLETFRQARVAPCGYTWADTYGDFNLPAFLPEEKAVRAVRAVINHAASDADVRGALKQQLIRFFNREIRDFNPQPGRQFRESFGMEGPEQAARLIAACLNR